MSIALLITATPVDTSPAATAQRFLAARDTRDAAKIGAAWSVFLIVRWAMCMGIALLALANTGVVLRQVAACFALPRMTNHVAALVILSVTCFLEHQVFRKVLGVVTQV